MEEDLGVKAPVTRLRRRLSTEAEGARSPLTPSTPTKKRSTRLAKPALELIDENNSTPTVKGTPAKRGTRKTSTKDVECLEETAVTPSRRSTRIRSNTSLVLEAVQNVVTNSPRAKRAARRASQLGSDTESSTPAKPARRTRKDSSSSIEKLAVTNSNEKAVALVADAITEEPEKENKNDASTPTRKSPSQCLGETDNSVQNKTDDIITKNDEVSSSTNEPTSNEVTKINKEPKSQDTANLSQDSAKLIDEIDSKPTKSRHGNKTISSIEESSNDKPNRKRTKSCNTMTSADSPSGNINPNKFDSVDGVMNKIDTPKNNSAGYKEIIDEAKSAQDAEDIVKILERTSVKDIKSIVYVEDSDSNSGSVKLTIEMDRDIPKNDTDDQCVPVVKNASPKRLASESFVVEPMDIDETIPENVTINDFSDKSNTSEDQAKETDEKLSTSQSHEKLFNNDRSSEKSRTSSINQQHELNSLKTKSINSSEENKNKSNQSIVSEKSPRKSSTSQLHESFDDVNEKSKSKRKSSLSKTDIDDKRKSSISFQVEEKQNESVNKSKRNSVSDTETQNASSNENKSTLVLSQLKDVSANESNNAVKSANDSNNDLSKTDKALAKAADKQNPSLNTYLTSTPLQQKSLQKLAMQINTSVISPSTEIENTSRVNKTKTPVKNMSKAESDSDSSSEEDDSQSNSRLVDDEAEEVSDNYESGVSRDDAEKLYEKEHEIPDKGETLESEQNFSEDSDYEKDSFVVSSDEEDEDLLSGSGDDLSLSDKDLKMTSKSKKKFDERKRKEQKKASKEMYEARHNLNESKTKSKKPSSSKLESSESEEEHQPKKKNRQRIDSINEDVDESVCVKKKKTKRLSESACEDNPTEMEITLNNQSVTEKKDPLAAAIKQEPNTPQKDLNMSVALIKDNIEQVQLDSNASVFKPNETSDPLQATVAQDDEDSDSDDSNLSLFSLENKEITEKYDSVLETLNKNNDTQKEPKTQNVSLNWNEKKKENVKAPIIDQLNLTQTKKSKKNKNQTQESNEKSVQEPKTSKDVSVIEDKKDYVENSDSIEFRLLFSEDSNDSEVNKSKFNVQEKHITSEKVIPLKKCEAKTNLRDQLDEPDGTEVPFFIDTKGDFEEMETSTQNSSRKKKNRASVAEANDAEVNTSETTYMPTNVSLNSAQKKNKNKSVLDGSQINDNTAPEESQPNTSLNESRKKKNKSLLDGSQVTANPESEKIPETNVSLNISKKKKNKSLLHVSQITEDSAPVDTSVNVSLTSNKKKQKNKSQLDISEIEDNAAIDEAPANISSTSDKKKKSLLDVSHVAKEEAPDTVMSAPANTSFVSSEKKKKKNKSLDVSHIAEEEVSAEIPTTDVSLSSEKKKKKKKNSTSESIVESVSAEIPTTDVSLSSEKKKKKKKNSTSESIVESVSAEIPTTDVSLSSEKKKKKKKNSTSESIVESVSAEIPTTDFSLSSEKKKKKKKNSTSESIVESDSAELAASVLQNSTKKKVAESHSSWTNEEADDDSDSAPEEVAYKSLKNSDKSVVEEDEPAATKSKNKFKKKKKKKVVQPQQEIFNVDVKAKKRKHNEFIDAASTNTDVFLTTKGKKKKLTQSAENDGMKTQITKRKASGDDSVEKKSKVFKGNFFEKIHVPRLPDAIVSQLADQPQVSKLQKKMQALSTVPFVVEEGPRRKNKPSNYLEQSVYLNDSVSPKKKKKSTKKVPKVLPFTPTAITSAQGYTSNFKLNVLPENTDFIAQASVTSNFKEQYLSKQRITKLKTERYKRQNNYKNKF